MQSEALLLVYAQIGTAFVGFAGLVAVFGKTSQGEISAWAKHRTRTLLEAALTVVLYALLPFSLHAFGLQGPLLWIISSAVAVVMGARNFYSATRRRRGVQHDPGATYSLATGNLLTGIGSLVLVFSFLNLLGIFGDRARAVYLLNPAFMTILSGVTFLRMVMSGVGVPSEVGKSVSAVAGKGKPESKPETRPLTSHPEISYAVDKTGTYEVIADSEEDKGDSDDAPTGEMQAVPGESKKAENLDDSDDAPTGEMAAVPEKSAEPIVPKKSKSAKRTKSKKAKSESSPNL